MAKVFIKQYLFGNKTPKEIMNNTAKRIQEIINDKTSKKTEVIRENGFVHGRMHPINKN